MINKEFKAMVIKEVDEKKYSKEILILLKVTEKLSAYGLQNIKNILTFTYLMQVYYAFLKLKTYL